MSDAISTNPKTTHLRSTRRSTTYKVAISILFGLLGFILNFYPLDFVFYGSYKMSFLFGLVFPMVITLAWGWKWGLLSALCGGCQTMWFLWFPQSHYAALVSVPPFTLWIVWLGWFSRTKRTIYLGETLFRIFNTALLYTLFRWAFTFTVPPANTAMPLSVAHSIVFKETLNGVLILFLAQALLQSNAVRRFLKLPKSTANPQTYYVYTNAIILSVILLFCSLGERYIWNLWGSDFQDMARILGSLALLMVGIACTYSTAKLYARRRIDALIRAKEALRISEEKPSQIVAGNPVPTFVIDTEHTVTHWNKACEVLSDVPAEDMVGTTRQWSPFYATKRPVLADLIVDRRPEEDIADYYGGRCKHSTLIAGAYEGELFFPHLGESGKWIFFTAAPLKDQRGKIIGAIETLQDITERKGADKRILHLNSTLSAIRNVNQLIVTEKDRTTLLQKACDALVEARGYDAAWLAFSDDGEEFDIVAGSGPGEETSRMANHLGSGDLPSCVKTMLAQNEQLLVFDKPRECEECPFRNAYAGQTTVTIRVEHGGSHFGLLAVSLGTDIAADDQEQSLLTEVASDIAIALRNMELEEAQEQANQALRESEERFQHIADVLPVAFWVYSADNETALYASPGFEKIFGYPSESLYQSSRLWLEVIHPEDRGRIEAIEQAHGAEEREKEYRIIQPDGSIHWIHSLRVPVRDEHGEISNIVGFAEDITERKQAEVALLHERNKAQQYLDVAGVMLLALNSKGEITLLNARGCQILGCTEEEAIGKNWFDLFIPERLRHDVRSVFAQLIAGQIEMVEYFENPVVTRSGEEKMISWHNVVLTDPAGNILGILGSGEDITERKRAEEALEESEARYRLLAENSADVIWTLDMDQQITYMSPSITRLTGYPAEEAMTRTLQESLTPASARMALDAFTEAMALEASGSGDANPRRTVELEYIRKDGSTVWAESVVTLLRDLDGHLVGLLGATRDIAERQQVEETLLRRDAILETVSYSAARLLTATNWVDVIAEESERLGKAAGADRVYVRQRVDGPVPTFRSRAALGWRSPDAAAMSQELPDTTFSMKGHVLKRWLEALASGKAVWGDAQDFPAVEREYLIGRDIRSAAALPVFAGKQWWGFIVFQNLFSQRHWSAAEIEALKTAAGTLGAAIQSRRAQEALRESEERFQQMAEVIPAIFWMFSGDKRQVLYVSPAFERIYDRPCDHVYEDPQMWLDAVYPEDREPLAPLNQEFRGKPHELEYRITQPDGSIRWIHDHVLPVLDEAGEIARIVGLSEDITERKLADEELNQRNEQLERFNAMAVGRELRMIKLKQEINALLRKLGQEARYETIEGASGEVAT